MTDDDDDRLHLAVRRNNFTAAAMLVAAGADINARDADGQWPLQMARDAWPVRRRCHSITNPTHTLSICSRTHFLDANNF